VDDVSSDIEGEVSADGSWGRVGGVGCAKKGTSSLGGVLSLPDHGDDGSGGEVLGESSEEGLGAQVRVVSLGVSLGHVDELESNKLESLLLKAGDDLTDKSTLDSVGLDGDEGSLVVSAHCSCLRL